MHRFNSTTQSCKYYDHEQSRHDDIAYCLDNQYHALRKHVPANSEFLFGDDLPKRIMNVAVTELINSRNNTAAIIATNISNKRNIQIGRST